MIIKSIELENIRSYADAKIEFPAGSVLLAGDIGSGKSTILMAIDFALFGLRRGEITGSDLLRHGKNSGYVKINFSLDDKNIEIKRTLKDNRGIAQDSGYIEINGLRTELSPTEMKARIINMLGYPSDMLRKNRPIFKYTVYTPQEEMKNIMLNPVERIETLRKIFDIEKYGLIRNNAKVVITELRSMKREYDALSKDMEEKEKLLQEKKDELDKIKNSLEDKNKIIEIIDKAAEKKKFQLSAIEKDKKDLDEMRKKLMRSETEIDLKQKRFADIDRSAEEIDKDIMSLENELEVYRDFTVPEINIEETKENISALQTQKEKIISNIAVSENTIEKHLSILEKGLCDFCGQEVHDKHRYEHNIRNMENHIDYQKKSIERLNTRLEELNNTLWEIERFKQDLLKKTMLEKAITEKESQKMKLTAEKESLAYEIERIEHETAFIRPKMEQFSVIEEDIKKLNKELDVLIKEKLDEEKNKSRLEQQMEDSERAVMLYESEIKEKKEKKEKAFQISETVNWIENFFSPLMETIEKHVMISIQSEFNALFQKWFGIIMGDEIMNVRIDDSFTPVIEQNGYETDYFNLSGGEKTSVALSYRLALNHVINSMLESIKTDDLLILDEPTDGFSADQLDRIRDVINELKLSQIILVSHEPKIDTFVDNVIRLYKQNHVTTISS